MKDKISIILPIFNVGPHLRGGIDSLINQTIGNENLEIIMVDTDKNVMLVKGNVPGPKRGYVVVKTTVKRVKSVPAKEILVRTAKVEEVVETTKED